MSTRDLEPRRDHRRFGLEPNPEHRNYAWLGATRARQGIGEGETEWQEFRSPDFQLLNEKLRDRVIFDGRNLYEPAAVSKFGLQYYAMGRGQT